MRSGTPPPSVRVRADPLPTPYGRHFFLPDRAVKSAGRSVGGLGEGVPVTHKANRNEKHCRWKRTRGGDGDAGSVGGGRGVNHLASCAASILQLPPTTTHLPLGRKEEKNRERERERKGKRDREKKKKKKLSPRQMATCHKKDDFLKWKFI